MTMCISRWYFNEEIFGRKSAFALSELVIEKSFKISASQNPKYSLGDIISFGTSDSDKFGRITTSLMYMIYIPISISLGIYFLYKLIGLAFLPSMVFLVFLMGFNFMYAKKGIHFQREMMKVRGQRIEKTEELFNNIRFIKSNCLEMFFARKLDEIRNAEVSWIRKMVYRQIYTIANINLVPSVMNITCFGTYLLMGYQLNIAIIFTTIAVMRNFNFGLAFLPSVISALFDFLVSSQRLTNFLDQEEIVKAPNQYSTESNLAIDIRDYSFQWKAPHFKEVVVPKTKVPGEGETKSEKDKKAGIEEPLLIKTDAEPSVSPFFKLDSINLKVRKGDLLAIIGKIRSGKTSFTMALLNEMYPLPGENAFFASNPNVSFVAQKPWIRNETLMENILFGETYNEKKYQQVLEKSFLIEDLKEFEKGDMTVIGDKGINLSGGQKTRVAVARALYSNKEMLIFDDPLSALDVNVGNQLFEGTIKEYLKDKTRVIVTHNIVYLKYCDQIVLMDEGRVHFNGTYEELTKNEKYKEFEVVLKENQEKIDLMHKKDESEISAVEDFEDEIEENLEVDVPLRVSNLKKDTSPRPSARKMSIARINIEEELKDKGEFNWGLLLEYLSLGSLFKISLAIVGVSVLSYINVIKNV